jgi:hypothetical protein
LPDTGSPRTAREVWRSRAAPGLLLGVFACTGALSLLEKSPTYDETAHLAAGYYSLQTGRFDLYSNNPPLSKLIGAVPLLTLHPALPARIDDNHWLYGFRFQIENAARYHSLFVAARLTMLLVGVLLGAFIFLWSRTLFGPTAAVAALALFAVSPNLLAHATLVTPDVALTTFFFATVAAFHRCCLDPSYARFGAAGAAFGLALLSKFTAVLLLPLLLLLAWYVPRRRVAGLAIAFATALLVVNAGYLFRDVFYPFGGIVFQSQLFRSLPAWLRLPIPADWLQGMDAQLADNAKVVPSYLLGRTYPDGAPWYYELVAVGLKTTIPLLLLAGAGVVWLLRGPRREAVFLIVPVGFLLFVFAAVVKLEIGLRYVLPIYPFLMVAGGYAAARLWQQERAALRAVAVGLLAWHAGTSAAAYPSYLSYFNELVGGGRNGWRYLADSNLDWGQDLPALEHFMKERGIGEIGLSYFGLVDPAVYGIQYHLIPDGPLADGWYAVSATNLVGIYDPERNPVQTLFRGGADLSPFRGMEPVEVLGHTIFVYRIAGEGSSAVR